MLNSSLLCLTAVLLGASGTNAAAEQTPQGFAVERLYLSAPGAGWLVMDALQMHGGLGGAVSLNVGYANNPLRITEGAHSLSVVANQASANLGLAVTYDRLRLYLNFDTPLLISGKGGTAGNDSFTAPSVDWGSHPDTLSDVRIGFDARVLGEANSRLRLGAGGQLFVPSGNPSDDDSDGTWRAMLRALVAGDFDRFTYAAHLGVHIRPLSETRLSGGPEGSELLFGAAFGPRFLLDRTRQIAIIAGPEVYGETAFKGFFEPSATGLEALASGRIEWLGDHRANLRVKVGVGGGLDPRFGAPEWRAVVGVEMFGNASIRP